MKQFVFIMFFLVSACLHAQSISFMAQQEDSLQILYEKMLRLEADEDKLRLNLEFKNKLRHLLYKPVSFKYRFEKLHLCKLISPDEKFRVFNWNVPLNDGSFIYEGFVLFPGDKESTPRIVELRDHSSEISNAEMKTLDGKNWYGALYYEIIPFKKGKKQNYILLGWDGNNDVTNKKIIDVLSINGNRLKFGLPVFKGQSRANRRIFFEYGEDWNMTVRYDHRNKRIIFDHLAPSNPNMEGNLAFYGPDLSFDCYELKKGKWIFKEDFDFRRGRDQKDKDFKEPSPPNFSPGKLPND